MTTATVREAMNFSAALRQSRTIPLREKLRYVDKVIKDLEMESYADAVIGEGGDGGCFEAHFAECHDAIELLYQC